MKKLIILSAFLITPLLVSAAKYVNTTAHPLIISKTSSCYEDDKVVDEKCMNDVCMQIVTSCVCTENEPCVKTESVELAADESVDFENDQDQPVTILSTSLNEKREFFPTNNYFNYEITAAKYSPKFPRLTINHAQ